MAHLVSVLLISLQLVDSRQTVRIKEGHGCYLAFGQGVNPYDRSGYSESHEYEAFWDCNGNGNLWYFDLDSEGNNKLYCDKGGLEWTAKVDAGFAIGPLEHNAKVETKYRADPISFNSANLNSATALYAKINTKKCGFQWSATATYDKWTATGTQRVSGRQAKFDCVEQKANPISVEVITLSPTQNPSIAPTRNTKIPTRIPTLAPTKSPSQNPTGKPTAVPTVNNICTYPECESNLALDIAFLMDESGSIDRKEWQTMVNFVERLITWDINAISYVSLIEYGSLNDFSQFLDFTQSTQSKKASIISALQNNEYTEMGSTHTRDAIERTLELFKQWNINSDPDAERPDLLFLLTDGTPTDNVCPDLENIASHSDVEIVLIGIGNGLDPITWTDQLDCLNNNKAQNAFYVSQFTVRDFNRIEGDLREKTCKNAVANSVAPPLEFIDSSSYVLALRAELTSLRKENQLLYVISLGVSMLTILLTIGFIYLCWSSKQNGIVSAMHFYSKTPQNDPQEI